MDETFWTWKELGDSCSVTDGEREFLVCTQQGAAALCAHLNKMAEAMLPPLLSAVRLYTDELGALRKLREAAISWMDCERGPDESRGMHMDREQLLMRALHEAIDACRTTQEANND